MRNDLNKIPIHFLIGMGRSGTTLLTMILNEHREIISTPENNFLLYFFNNFRHKIFIKEEEKKSFVTYFSKRFNEVISIWKPDRNFFEKVFENNPGGISYRDLCKLIYLSNKSHSDRKEVRMIVDKNPVYSLHLNKISEFLPDSKFIVLVRDYRDNALSQRKNFTGFLDLVSIYSTVWKIYYQFILRFYKENPQKLLFVKYEDLVHSPMETLQKICAFLGIDFNEKMLEFYKNISNAEQQASDSLSPEEFKIISKMHKNLALPINASHINKWKQEFSLREIRTIENIAGKTGDNFGYSVSQKISFFEKIFFYLLDYPFVVIAGFHVLIFSVWRYKIPLKLRGLIPKWRGK